MSASEPSSSAECGCCEGIVKITPVAIQNPPGLPSISFRVGTQPAFKETMIASLNKYPALSRLTTRSDDDLSIDLFDAWATVADVLTFYQERIANEGYLRTAKERVSVLQLARSIGYELSPGLAATAYLAFTIDPNGSVTQTTINKGTRVTSVPLQGQTPPQMPQAFETMKSIVAYPQFNAIQPRLTRPQMYSDINTVSSADGLDHVYFSGTSTKLSPGDKLLFVSAASQTPLALRTVSEVTPNSPSAGQTDVALASDPSDQYLSATAGSGSGSSSSIMHTFLLPEEVTGLDSLHIEKIISLYPTQSDLTAFLARQGWDYGDFAAVVNSFAGSMIPSSDVQVYAMRVKTGIFGNTAPNWNTLAPTVIEPKPIKLPSGTVTPSGFPNNWDSTSAPFPVNESSQGTNYGSGSTIYLSSSYPAVTASEWVVLRDTLLGATTGAYQVSSAWDESRADFLISAKVTGLTLDLAGAPPLSDFTMRGTTVYAQSEELELAQIPDETPVEGTQITLGSVVAGLQVGQTIAVTGQLTQLSGQTSTPTESEIVTISNVELYTQSSPFTTITVQSLSSPTTGLVNSYQRETVTINANVALSTNGSTVSGEVLGSGDPSQPYTTFTLKQDPLTFVPSSTSPNGAQSTLNVFVSNGGTNIEWNLAPSLYNIAANSQSYAVRIQDDLSVDVLFGSARPPVGSENITATYRVGIGSAGMVQANQLTQLASRPLGLTGVTNPLPASGAADPEGISSAQQSAPLEVLTMGRIVSLDDCQNFALAFQGIGKAVAVYAWAGETQYIRLIVSSAMNGQVVEPLLGYLETAISNFSDPSIQVSVEPFEQLSFNIQGWIIPASDQDPDTVQQNVIAALQSAFSFDSMDFGQPVYLSEVISTIQQVEGVVAADVTALYLTTASAPEANDTLACEINALLTINPDPQGVNLSVNSS